tara:strand:- start:3592 stop:4344 length:753 start_codon:yes stop_codon:yes gene_type:complete
MVFINLISNLPIFDESTPEGKILKNQVSLGLGLVLYIVIGGLIYTDKIPSVWLSTIPDKRYLALILGLDIALFFIIYKFRKGYFPPLSISGCPEYRKQETLKNIREAEPLRRLEGGGSMEVSDQNRRMAEKANRHIEQEQLNRNSRNVDETKKGVRFNPNQIINDMTLATSRSSPSQNLMSGMSDEISTITNDLESTFKKPGQHKQTEYPDEVSIPGNSYFEDDDKNTKVENWEMDEYTHDEFIPDDLDE